MSTTSQLKKNIHRTLIIACSFLIGFNVQASIESASDMIAPDITGKYEFDRFGMTGAYVITKTAEGIHIEKYDNGETYKKISKAGKYPEYIVGDYSWESSRGAYMQSTTVPGYRESKFLLFKVNATTLAIRNSRFEVGIFKKIQGSLSDLVNSKRADVSHLIGNWNIAGVNSSVRFTNGVDHDLQVRYGSNVYQLDKEESGVFETFSGTSRSEEESLSFKVMSPGRIKLSIGGTDVIATKAGGASPARKMNSTTATASTSTATTSAIATTTSSAALNATDKLMFKALKEGDEDAVKETIDAGANVNARNPVGRTALHEAVLSGDSYLLEAIIEQNANINATDRQGRTPLETAISKSTASDASMVTVLLDHRPTVSNYAIDQAIQKGNDEIISGLIDAGANKSYMATKAIEKGKIALFDTLVDEHSITFTNAMFETALLKNKMAIAEKMIENNFSPNYAMEASIKKNAIDLVYLALEKGGKPDSALKFAIKKNDTQLATNAVTEHGADVAMGLNEAVLAKNSSMATIMLDNGAKANTQMAAVAKTGNLEILDLLLSNEGDANLGMIPAATAGKTKAVGLLLEYEANPNTLLDWAVTNNNTAFTTQAITAQADATDEKYIAQAATNGNLDIVTALLDAGASADDGMMPATKNNKTAIVQKLLVSGADGSSDNLLAASAAHNNTTLTNLFIAQGASAQAGIIPAVNNSAAQTLQLLIDSGATVDNNQLLLTSVQKDCTACAKILVGEGLEANYQEAATGKYLLHYAAEKSNAAIIRILLENDAEVNAEASGNTPLHLAVRNRKGLAAVDALIQGGADVNATDGKGKKVLKIAKGNKIKKLLKQAGAVKK